MEKFKTLDITKQELLVNAIEHEMEWARKANIQRFESYDLIQFNCNEYPEVVSRDPMKCVYLGGYHLITYY